MAPQLSPRRAWGVGAILLALPVLAMAWVLWPSPASPGDEARAALASGRAAVAERALERAERVDPRDPIPWRLRLELLRLEDRRHEALRVGRRALAAVAAPARRDVLKAWTLALLADVPDDPARAALRKFLDADPGDVEARVALLRRIAADPRPDDPGLAERLAALEAIVAAYPGHPSHPAAREALVEALADAGEPGRGRAVLDSWPEAARDARYDRLAARWALEYDRDPARALEYLQAAVADGPQDWKARYLRARALHALGRTAEAAREAEAVGRLRELLDPRRLGRRLDADLARLETPDACRDLADLCGRLGLDDLAAAWRREADAPAPLVRVSKAPAPRP